MTINGQAQQKICDRCIMDHTVAGIKYDENGECTYCKIHDIMEKQFPKNDAGREKIDEFVTAMKKKGKNKDYDCVIGVSGGTDSTYLLHFAKQRGLRPLAAHLDNGWNSEIAVSNVKNSVAKLGFDLQTYVIEWEESKDILASFLRAGYPWADAPTDLALTAALYKIAVQEGIHYVMVGNDFRSEGKQPIDWTYADGKTVKSIHKQFGKVKMKTFPNLTLPNLFYYGFLKNIKLIRPFYFMDYNKEMAKKTIEKEYNWKDYGGHHHESIFTRFAIAYWMPKKFNMDKRKVTYSAWIRSGLLTREQALEKIKLPPYEQEQMARDVDYVLKKLDMSRREFDGIMAAPVKKFTDYPSYYPLFLKYRPIVEWGLKLVFPWKPSILISMENK